MTRPPSIAQWRELLRAGDPRRRDELVLAYTPLVHDAAVRLAARLPRHVDEQDLESAGLEGLLEAVQRFDPDRGVRFETFALAHVNGRMLDELRRLDWVPRSVRERAGPSLRQVPLDASVGEDGSLLVELVEDEHAERPEDEAFRTDLQALLHQTMSTLPPRDALVLYLHYFEELSLAEIAELLHIGASRASGLHARSLAELHGALADAVGAAAADGASSFIDAA
jgi:RNA polymerase sigma factor for flagellar operon FliA